MPHFLVVFLMSYYTLWVIAFGLAMDAFTVSITKGLCLIQFSWRFSVKIALCFGVFQGVMPLLGYYIGLHFSQDITEMDHWVAFILLSIIGIHMIRESLKEENEEKREMIDCSLKHLITLSVATSIDALAMGVSFAFLQVNIWAAITLIALMTTLLCLVGVKAGYWLGGKMRKHAERLGGMMLLGIGVHILYEHHVFG